MHKASFHIIAFLVLLVFALLIAINDIFVLVSSILIGGSMILFPKVFSKNLVTNNGPLRVVMTPKTKKGRVAYYSPEEFYGEKKGVLLVRITGILFLVGGILVYIIYY